MLWVLLLQGHLVGPEETSAPLKQGCKIQEVDDHTVPSTRHIMEENGFPVLFLSLDCERFFRSFVLFHC